jgi:hypothetical protein
VVAGLRRNLKPLRSIMSNGFQRGMSTRTSKR